MATLTEVATVCGVSSRWISQLIAEGVLPNAAKGKCDVDACYRAYMVHVRERLIAQAPRPDRERTKLIARLLKSGSHDEAQDLAENNGRETRGRFHA